ncbi:protein brambleberry isoform X2 [Halyomorpha halys]|uniref:protein brambleberry isoform X2 n=1 Tax=Halyomorpha halys TaxID=286706 RepID=UPI0006D4F614|nr:protein brambleberry-like isoform X2 [Halyomorpha halys]
MTVSRLILLGLLLRQQCASHLLDWFGWGSAPQFIGSSTPLLDIPFEELGPEDKFLVEASKITGLKLAQLDVCQHKIVMKIKASCGTLSDEEIAKLSVNLLNCQADVEGRKTFPCTTEMSLRACTSEMDAETWNAYHIMSNRARAVCYASRQEEFRALAEMTINRLVATARTHIEQMATVHERQSKLEKATQIALDRISQSQHDVLASYTRLRRLESGLGAKLIEDKSGLEEIGNMVTKEAESIDGILKDFKKALDDAGKELINQKKEESGEHEKLMAGLKDSLTAIDNIINKINTVSTLLDNHSAQYSSESKSLFSDLKELSKSINEISSNANALRKLAEQKMSLVSTLIGETGENFDTAVFISLHILCLLTAMVISSFLEFRRRWRVLIVSSGFLNTYLSINNMPYSLRLLDLYLFLAGAVIVDTVIVQILRQINEKNSKAEKLPVEPEKKEYTRQERELNGFKKPLSKVDEWLTEKFSDREIYAIRNGSLPTMTPVSRGAALVQDDEMSVTSGVSTRSRRRHVSPPSSIGGSSTTKTMCSAVRPNGQRCKLPAKSGQLLCRIHENNR